MAIFSTVLLFGCGNKVEEGYFINIGDCDGNKTSFNIGNIRTYRYPGDKNIVLDRDIFYIDEESTEKLAIKMQEADKNDFPDRTYTVKGDFIIVRDGQNSGQTYYIWKKGDKIDKRTGYYISNGCVTVGGTSDKIILPPSTARKIIEESKVLEISLGREYMCDEGLNELKELYIYNGFSVTEEDGEIKLTKEPSKGGKVKMFNVKHFDDKVLFFIE